MRKNFDIVPREEAIIKAGYVFPPHAALVLCEERLLTVGEDRNRIFRNIWGVLHGYRVR